MNQPPSSQTQHPQQKYLPGTAALDSISIYEETRQLLLRLGASPRYAGFGYTACAVSLSLKEWPRCPSLTKEIYPRVACYYHVSPCCVDRNIRTLINVLWREDADLLRRAAACPLPEKPSCGAFLAILTERLALSAFSQ
ncbi:MAG: sporulation initiation factor Spo0A C-terminal domain-containing protein [Lachnospiraceae bacterium]|nr:sporulation initiation factor Spo0A C-terminal domain-containing protein [Lachnospiraceae bacterium]